MGGSRSHPQPPPECGPAIGGASIAPLRPYDLALASDTSGGGSKQGQWEACVAFCDWLWRRQKCIEKQRGRKQPEVDCSAEHDNCSRLDRNGEKDARNCCRAPSGPIRSFRLCTRNPRWFRVDPLDLGSRSARPHLNRRSFRFASALLAALNLVSRYSDRSPTSSRISFSVIR